MGEGVVMTTRLIEILLNGNKVRGRGPFPPEDVEDSHDEPLRPNQ
jgi:hypothetical protein